MATRPWVPTDLPAGSLGLWVDFSDAASLTVSAGKISQATDKSGSGNTLTQSTPSRQPSSVAGALNGLSVARFSSSNLQKLTVSNLGNFTYTSYGVGIQSSSSNNGGFLDISDTTSTNRTFLHFWESGSYKSRYGGTGTDSSVSATTDVARIIGATGSATSRVAYADGVAGGASTNTATQISATNLRIGSLWSDVYYWLGDIGEVVLANIVLAAVDRQKLEGYLAWKWGLQANLPANHPYKAAAPTVDTGGGTAYNDTLSEAASASDTASAVTIYGASRAEALIASDSAVAAANLAASLTEAASASDLVSTGGAVAVSIAESLSASDAVTGAATLSVSLTEAASATDAATSVTTFLAALTEAVAASDIVVTGAAMGAISEAVTASDSTTGTASFSASLAEAASAADSVAGALSGAAVLAEPAAASDLVASGGAVTLAIAESVTATDAVAAGTVSVVALLEAGSAADAISYTYLPNPYPYITPDVLLSGSLVGPVTLRAQMQADMITLQARLRN